MAGFGRFGTHFENPVFFQRMDTMPVSWWVRSRTYTWWLPAVFTDPPVTFRKFVQLIIVTITGWWMKNKTISFHFPIKWEDTKTKIQWCKILKYLHVFCPIRTLVTNSKILFKSLIPTDITNCNLLSIGSQKSYINSFETKKTSKILCCLYTSLTHYNASSIT